MKVALLTDQEITVLLETAVQQALLAAAAKQSNSILKGDQLPVPMKQLCQELSLSRTMIYRFIRAGVLKPKRLPGSRRLFFTRDQILAAMAKVDRNNL